MGFVNRKAIVLGSLAILGLLTVNAVLVYTSLRAITEANERTVEVRGLLLGLNQAENLLHTAVIVQNGYLLTGDTGLLKSFDETAPKVLDLLKQLRQEASNSVESQEKLDTLRDIAEAEFITLREAVDLRRRSGLEAVLRLDRTKGELQSMGRARAILRDLSDIQAQDLGTQTERSQAAVRRTILLFTVSTALGAILAAFVAYLQKRDADRAEVDTYRIRTSDAWLSTALTTIREALIATDAQAKIRLVNPLAEDLIGWTQDEAYGRPILDVMRLIDPATGRPTDNPVERLIYEGRPEATSGITVVVSRDGRETTIDHSVAPIISEDNEWLGVVLAFRETGTAGENG